MNEYISRETLLKAVAKMDKLDKETHTQYEYDKEGYILLIETAPAADVVSAEAFKQVQWERDMAIEQLHSYGVELGEEAELTRVKYGKWEEVGCWGDTGSVRYRCTTCDETTFDTEYFMYCPKCGAKMNGAMGTKEEDGKGNEKIRK